MDCLAQQQVPTLIRESAALQVTKILRGDYNLKIARQDYFTSNQDQVGGPRYGIVEPMAKLWLGSENCCKAFFFPDPNSANPIEWDAASTLI